MEKDVKVQSSRRSDVTDYQNLAQLKAFKYLMRTAQRMKIVADSLSWPQALRSLWMKLLEFSLRGPYFTVGLGLIEGSQSLPGWTLSNLSTNDHIVKYDLCYTCVPIRYKSKYMY